MRKVIKSYGGSSLPTGHKRPLIYNLSDCAWLKAAGIPLRLAVLKVSICTLRRLQFQSVGLGTFETLILSSGVPVKKFFSHLYTSGNVQESDENSHLWFFLCGGHVEILHSEHLRIPVRVLKSLLRADVSKYRPEVCKSQKSKILKKIHKVALGKLLT